MANHFTSSWRDSRFMWVGHTFPSPISYPWISILIHIQNPNETLHTMSRSTIDHLRSSLQFCRIFLTDSGHLGIASSPVEVDDIVCIIKGADSPCILRLTSSTSWALVCGDCHVLDGDYKSRYMERFSCRAYPEEYCDELEEVSIY